MQKRMVENENSSPTSVSVSLASGESSNLLTVDDSRTISDQSPATILPVKKKRNLPGMPDPDSEVIALSPKSLLATNRFLCEICNKGFQRDQNLQLHRRGHNLPWKLRQRSSKDVVKRRVYVCPEPSCVHHDPSRALGDLTGIKKHFCRKHGEKKYKCERCSKKYAVQSDWKAHMKTCGTREYPCDCGTLFSRRDSFITHRSFCDALAQESARPQPPSVEGEDLKARVVAPPPAMVASSSSPPPLTPSTVVLSPVLSIQLSGVELPENQNSHLQPPPPPPIDFATPIAPTITIAAATSATVTTSTSSTTSVDIPTTGGPFFASLLNSPATELPQSSQQPATHSSLLPEMSRSRQLAIDPMSLSLSSSFYGPPSLFPTASQDPLPHYSSRSQAALSATALLQKAAEMGSTSSNSSFLRALGLAPPSVTRASTSSSTLTNWNSSTVKIENNSLGSGFGPSSRSSGFNELMMGPTMIFGSKPATFDFLGLGMGECESSPAGFSAFLSSIGGGLNIGSDSFGGTWDNSCDDQKPPVL